MSRIYIHLVPGTETNTAGGKSAGRQAEASLFSPCLLSTSSQTQSTPQKTVSAYVFKSWPLLSSLPPLSWTSKVQSSPISTRLVSDSSSKMQFVIFLGPGTSVFNPESKMHTALLAWLLGPLTVWSQPPLMSLIISSGRDHLSIPWMLQLLSQLSPPPGKTEIQAAMILGAQEVPAGDTGWEHLYRSKN